MSKIGFVGSGNMAEAIVKGIISKSLFSEKNICVSDISSERLEYMKKTYGVSAYNDNAQLVDDCDIVVLSVKPQVMADALGDISGVNLDDKLFVSIAAGIRISKIEQFLGDVAIVRVMPNTPALVATGATAIFANKKAESKRSRVYEIFSAIGDVVVVEDEGAIDAVTALSGSGPAYYFLLMEAMVKAGVEMGLDEEIATTLTLQTALGAAKLAKEAMLSGDSPAVLRERVTSPGGTTQAALEVLYDRGVDRIIVEAINRAKERSVELSR